MITNPKDAAKKTQFVQINGQGKISLNNTEMNEQQLLDTLVAFRKEDPDLSVVVRADSGLAVQTLVNVLDVLISANVAKFGLATEAGVKAAN